MMNIDPIDQLCVNAVRMLSCACIEQAGSGHPGLALGAAPMAYVLWRNHLHLNPEDSKWFDRNRFCRQGTDHPCCTVCFTCQDLI